MGKKKKLQKSLRICLSKIKKVPSQLSMQSSSAGRPAASASATSWILSACKHPKTPSFAVDRDRHPDDDDRVSGCGGVDPAATLSDVDRFLYENFNSLCSRRHDEEEEEEEATRPATGFHSSERFFVSPGSSSSLHDENGRRSTSTSPPSGSSQRKAEEVPGGGVAVTTFSKDPYEDFRRSMQEMVEARHGVCTGQPLDWDFMEELLFCYLELNDRSVHKYILRAFTELAVAFRRQNSRRRAPPENNSNKAKMKYYSKKDRMVDVKPRSPAGD
ncbi:transcription repressor OFP14-like [Zingiber officinale]|uniref:Transcription repressor n=1 Tax=Zingiber officinale TaxID=94328 RepID=A0A8J5GKK9_ZINOF|nr:transcription repressor OFP14-like [Zingiber officinale]KAG6508692.1 hypothetical protein ZIOFF_034072 [Zingiber officinale]